MTSNRHPTRRTGPSIFVACVICISLTPIAWGLPRNLDEGDDQSKAETPATIEAPAVRYFDTRAQAWTRIPSVTVAGAADDPRRDLVVAAVEFWNQQLAVTGSAFRLGEIAHVDNPIADEDLVRRSAALLSGQAIPPLPETVSQVPGDLIVVLSNADFVSYAGLAGTNRPALVAVSGYQGPRTLPNVMLNVVTHEIGHAIGLGHNDRPELLMCGRPASCRPDAFQSPEPRTFPITDVERDRLLRLYPPDWQPTR